VRTNGNNFVSTGINFDVGWEMDIWGKYARNIESSEATLYASIASYDNILVTIISEVARNYINYTTAQERIAFAKSNIAIQERVTKMTETQYNAGNVSELDMQQARTQLYSTQSLIPSFELSMIQSRNALAVLLGTLPSKIDTILKNPEVNKTEELFDYTNIPSYIPTAILDANFSVAADMVRRRPDIQIAELQAQAQNSRIGSAEAELYPHFTLFGSLGFNLNNATNGWTSAGDAVGITAGPAFSWNIFQYGRIKNQVRIQDAKFQESLANYNKKVLQAVSEVSNALNGYTLTKKQLELNKKSIAASIRAFDISMIQYNEGMVNYQRLLSTVEKLIKNEDAYALNKGSIATQIVLLYKALGGGWQLREGNSFVNAEDASVMRKRSDWGDYLDE
jgi:NodT family efflux transporter outer membrane factor (OMF) lipoprotein